MVVLRRKQETEDNAQRVAQSLARQYTHGDRRCGPGPHARHGIQSTVFSEQIYSLLKNHASNPGLAESSQIKAHWILTPI